MVSGLEVVVRRLDFYKRNYYRSMTLVILLLLALIGLIGFAVYQYTTRPVPQYFPTTPDGQLMVLPPLYEPFATDEEVVRWTIEAMQGILSMDYVNYRRTLKELRNYFTSFGYQDYIVALQKSRNIEALKAYQQVVTPILLDMPKIYQQGVSPKSNIYHWWLTFNLRLQFENSLGKVLKQDFPARVLIIRVSVLESEHGIAIERLLLGEGG